jgi:hypothetical protein
MAASVHWNRERLFMTDRRGVPGLGGAMVEWREGDDDDFYCECGACRGINTSNMKWPVGRAQICRGRLATSAVRGDRRRPELPIGPADRPRLRATYPFRGSKTAFE